MATQTRTINAGPVGIKPKGAYSSTATYSLLDTVLYNHDSWVCTAMTSDGSSASVTGQAPYDGSPYWKALTDGGRAAVAVGTQVRADFDEWFQETEAEWQGMSGNADADHERALADHTASVTATTNANTQAARAKEWADHPPYIANGTEAHPGDLNYWYIWNDVSDTYVKSPYAKGDDLHWEEMTPQEKEDLAERVLEQLTFATEETCEDIIDELT